MPKTKKNPKPKTQYQNQNLIPKPKTKTQNFINFLICYIYLQNTTKNISFFYKFS